jgi:hypothetical protein
MVVDVDGLSELEHDEAIQIALHVAGVAEGGCRMVVEDTRTRKFTSKPCNSEALRRISKK